MKPQLSIIIPCFNCAATVTEAVASCYKQGFEEAEFEIVLVNDASTDHTPAVLEQLVQEHSNVALFHHTHNKGGGAARNTAVSKTNSEVIFCLDSDDMLPENTLRRMFDHLVKKNCDGVGVHTSTKFIGNDTSNVYRVDTFAHANERIPFEALFEKDGNMCSLYSVFMFTKNAFAVTGGYPEDHGFDTQGFAWRFLSKHLYAEVCPHTNYLHRIKAGQSYYLREYASGNTNFNWQKIFLGHFSLFSSDAQRYILSYDCRDFTQSLFAHLQHKGSVLSEDYQEQIESGSITGSDFANPHQPINKNSWRGLRYRISHRLKQIYASASNVTTLTVPLRRTAWEIKSRLSADSRLQVLGALLRLKLKRLFKQGQTMPAPTSQITIDVVIPTLQKDAALLDTYLAYLKKNVAHEIGTIFIVAPATETGLQSYCEDNGLEFIDEKSVLGYGKNAIEYRVDTVDRSGWLFQQLLKLSGDQFVKNKKYLIVDSDTILINTHCFFSDEKTVFLESSEWNQPYYEAFENLFGYKHTLPVSFIAHMMLFDVDMLKQMKTEIEKRHDMPWDKAYIACCDKSHPSGISDYDTYSQWFIMHNPDNFLTRPFYNTSLPRKQFGSIDTISKTLQTKFNSLSFHSYLK